MCFTKRLFLIMALLGCSMVMGADLNPTNDALLEQLRHEDKGVRTAALRELQTTIDPRLPEQLLRLPSDEGSSARRLAARGIGSRYWQIPLERRPTYLEALERARKADPGIDLWRPEKEMLVSRMQSEGILERRFFIPSALTLRSCHSAG